jgi:hypothetical protein
MILGSIEAIKAISMVVIGLIDDLHLQAIVNAWCWAAKKHVDVQLQANVREEKKNAPRPT